ncbi:hypothetical protein PHLGIDRAFT_306274 [Phlebiopsis gigantea 11061_1 CR5-6]|uniref:Uncharacterized protein n=1 Tax=Phlebiopsis gigantea (strain 11061_1 CR5-6) TaxID=745531 RepID=A0A0C3NCD9_PHLG1|nr:hypothetical protein PHLGIDRAFT_306274 [Phlebiopsis gigantea 11061_1 CR5-6]
MDSRGASYRVFPCWLLLSLLRSLPWKQSWALLLRCSMHRRPRHQTHRGLRVRHPIGRAPSACSLPYACNIVINCAVHDPEELHDFHVHGINRRLPEHTYPTPDATLLSLSSPTGAGNRGHSSEGHVSRHEACLLDHFMCCPYAICVLHVIVLFILRVVALRAAMKQSKGSARRTTARAPGSSKRRRVASTLAAWRCVHT